MVQFKTPPIPDWINTLDTPGYMNIFALNLGNKNLSGTETLLGDWDGPVLVVAKDFAPLSEVERVMRGDPTDLSKVYRHNDGDGRYHIGIRTNTRLIRFMYGPGNESMITGNNNLECGALYISACFFLKHGDDPSANLNGWKPGSDVFEKSKRVFGFVLDHMPNLRAIACLGRDAQLLAHSAMNSSDLSAKSIGIYDHLHPSRGSNEAHENNWRILFNQSGISRHSTRLVGE